MKNLIKNSVLALALVSTFASARLTILQGRGVGGSTVNDRDAACTRAEERAEDNGFAVCENRNGDVLGITQNNDCRCRNVRGSGRDRDREIRCEATTRVRCDLPCAFSNLELRASGLGIDYSRPQACRDGFRRAESDNVLGCQQRGGVVLSSFEESCNCRRLSNGDYECHSTIASTCQISTCR